MILRKGFWQGKRVFVTGHTGFKGSWLSLWLQSLGAIVKGYALVPPTEPNLFTEGRVADGMESDIGDIRNLEHLRRSMRSFSPDIVIHMAAQPLVRYSYLAPIETYETNVLGTAKVMEAVRNCPSVRAVVSVTTDKCYENREWVWPYREDEPMGGHDPYSSSKGCAELVTSAYRRSFLHAVGVGVASARAGNVIGGGDWSEDRLIPDILRAFEKNKPVKIRHPSAIRPWQHVLEPLSGYLLLAEKLWQEPDQFAEGWNFGPYDYDAKPVKWVLDRMVSLWGRGAEWQLDGGDHPHEANWLKLDISKARVKLGWQPRWGLDEALDRVVRWHRAWLDGADMRQYCLNEIDAYMRGL